MSTPAPPDDRPMPEEGDEIAPATVVDLTGGPAHITPVLVDGEARYTVDLPDQPLAEDDVASLAVALQVAQSGPAVLVDVEDYLEAEAPPGEDTDYQL
ncbi:hypothetical protein RCG67_07800 [Kocuria sp. CPCC 205292]|jgi:hypothetical protein|uniref:Uncharacterized protein n=1 Tax=Kocuria rosea subsp. polaris TaxID=136273 RepID=A0A0W8IR13_KOCRO|nr:hypothetical protein [Kocuria polaris]KUG62235.1 hypothetical protein AVL61_04010 [Kocuria polaris]